MSEALSTVEETPVVEALVSQDPLDTPEVNKAAYDFEKVTARIRALSRNLGGKGLARVFIATTEFPFSANYPKFKNKTEEELFMITLHAQGLKGVMSQALDKHKKEIEALAIEGIVDEVKEQHTEAEHGKVE